MKNRTEQRHGSERYEDVKKKKEEEEGKEKMEDIEEQKWFEEVIGSRVQVLCQGDGGFERTGSGVTHRRSIIETRGAWFFVANTTIPID